jgi:hypothetical protein
VGGSSCFQLLSPSLLGLGTFDRFFPHSFETICAAVILDLSSTMSKWKRTETDILCAVLYLPGARSSIP